MFETTILPHFKHLHFSNPAISCNDIIACYILSADVGKRTQNLGSRNIPNLIRD